MNCSHLNPGLVPCLLFLFKKINIYKTFLSLAQIHISQIRRIINKSRERDEGQSPLMCESWLSWLTIGR